MIVSGLLLGFLGYKLFVSPAKEVMAVGAMLERHLNKPRRVEIQTSDGRVTVEAEDFLDDNGNLHTDVGGCLFEGKEILITREEYELLEVAEDQEDEFAKKRAAAFLQGIARRPSRRIKRER